MSQPSKRKAGRKAFGAPVPQRPRCENPGYCSERDWEGRCLDPKRGCEWNDVERALAKARLRESRERAQAALDVVNARLKEVVEKRKGAEEGP